MNLHFFQYCELMCLLASIILYRRLHKTVYVLAIPYLLIVVFVDVIASHVKFFYINNSNQWLFNLYLPFQHFFFSLIFRNIFTSILLKRTVDITIIFFSLFYLLNIFFIQGFFQLNNYTFIFTAILMIFYSGMYFLELMKKDSQYNFLKDSAFWMSTAALIFFTGFSVFFAVFFYYKDSPHDYQEHLIIYKFIRKYIITLHYLLFLISLLTVRSRQYV